MISSVRASALALIAPGLCLVLGAPAQAGCIGLSGTADGFDKETAVSRAQLALADYVKQYKTEKRLHAVSVSAMWNCLPWRGERRIGIETATECNQLLRERGES